MQGVLTGIEHDLRDIQGCIRYAEHVMRQAQTILSTTTIKFSLG
jgi:hypothetical protein